MKWYIVIKAIPGLDYKKGTKIGLYRNYKGELLWHVWRIVQVPEDCVSEI